MRPLILVFLQGTILMHQSAQGKSREEIIAQVRNGDPSVRDFAHYIPIGNAAAKLRAWAAQGAMIGYFSALTESRRVRGDEIVGKEGLKIDEQLLARYGFPHGLVYHRNAGESYADVVARMDPLPEVLIEDDCESIGANEITYPTLPPELKAKIKSIIVPEFGGVDYLPDNPSALLR